MVLYFTGTGNSRYLARRIAEGLDMPLYDLNTCIKAGDTAPVQTGQDVVLVTPTYAWRIPRVVSQWLGNTELTGAERIWFVMDCGSEIGNAAKYNQQLAAQKHLRYMGTAQIIMPENYIAMFNAPQAEQARRIVEQAEPALQKALAQVRAGQEFSPLRDTLYDRFMSGRSGANTAPTAWPASAIAPKRPSSTAKRAKASPGTTLKHWKSSRTVQLRTGSDESI